MEILNSVMQRTVNTVQLLCNFSIWLVKPSLDILTRKRSLKYFCLAASYKEKYTSVSSPIWWPKSRIQKYKWWVRVFFNSFFLIVPLACKKIITSQISVWTIKLVVNPILLRKTYRYTVSILSTSYMNVIQLYHWHRVRFHHIGTLARH